MTEDMKRERLQEILNDIDEATLFDMMNERRDAVGEDEMHYMGDLNDHFRGYTASDLLDEISRDFDKDDDYFVYDNYECLYVSFNDLYDYNDDGDLIDYILENDEDFYNDDIREVLDEETTDEDEEE